MNLLFLYHSCKNELGVDLVVRQLLRSIQWGSKAYHNLYVHNCEIASVDAGCQRELIVSDNPFSWLPYPVRQYQRSLIYGGLDVTSYAWMDVEALSLLRQLHDSWRERPEMYLELTRLGSEPFPSFEGFRYAIMQSGLLTDGLPYFMHHFRRYGNWSRT